MKKKEIIFVGECLYILIAVIVGGLNNKSSILDIERNVEVMETEVKAEEENSEAEVKVEEERLSETNINVHDSFIQIETKGIHQLIEFPSIDMADAYDVANIINEQIYNEIISEDFAEYYSGIANTEIRYEMEIIDERILSIHFLGYQSRGGSYAEYNKGLNFNMRTGEMILLKDYYDLSDIKGIIQDARDRNEINVALDFSVDKAEMEQQIDIFVHLFDSEEYMNRSNVFFLKDNHIYFIAPPISSMRQSIYMELDLDKFSKL